MRGLDGVRAEFSIMTSCFNITRMIALLGTERLAESVKAVAIAGSFAVCQSEIAIEALTFVKKLRHVRQTIEIYENSSQRQTA